MTTLMLPYPVSANRYWRTYNGRVVRSEEASAYRSHAVVAARKAGIRRIDGDVAVDMVFHPRANKGGEASARRLDLDNVLKVAIDALNGIAYDDDRQVVKISIEIGEAKHGGGLAVTVGRPWMPEDGRA